MVAFSEHDHGDGEACPGCQFKAALSDHLAWAADEPEETWHNVTGEITALMAGTITALMQLRAQRFDPSADDDDAEEHALMAASAIHRLGTVAQELWHALVSDDQADDDAGTGL